MGKPAARGELLCCRGVARSSPLGKREDHRDVSQTLAPELSGVFFALGALGGYGFKAFEIIARVHDFDLLKRSEAEEIKVSRNDDARARDQCGSEHMIIVRVTATVLDGWQWALDDKKAIPQRQHPSLSVVCPVCVRADQLWLL